MSQILKQSCGWEMTHIVLKGRDEALKEQNGFPERIQVLERLVLLFPFPRVESADRPQDVQEHLPVLRTRCPEIRVDREDLSQGLVDEERESVGRDRMQETIEQRPRDVARERHPPCGHLNQEPAFFPGRGVAFVDSLREEVCKKELSNRRREAADAADELRPQQTINPTRDDSRNRCTWGECGKLRLIRSRQSPSLEPVQYRPQDEGVKRQPDSRRSLDRHRCHPSPRNCLPDPWRPIRRSLQHRGMHLVCFGKNHLLPEWMCLVPAVWICWELSCSCCCFCSCCWRRRLWSCGGVALLRWPKTSSSQSALKTQEVLFLGC